ncbi:sigma-70 family RNA polymerase sigma factor [Candidatus Poribacteria bacterium]|nr:sigma-70 family RNA polymerase sigma factor [Candidatus Poribacteria bacterium]MYK22459.1 sigma-70 family RNA polymerase sigma factor [Candidatus Poribacteria bacterium]
MKNRDVELIHRILDGDDSAFSELVKKYQKPVHTLVWRKIGDFHIAEEITQDTFLKAYQKLGTLKQPQRFTGWLYVIAANNCKMWLRKKRLQTQPLEETDSVQLEKATYSQYVVEEKERTIGEAKREVVKQLLATLQESDRTVITLHYFSEMSAAEIGAFLGVSVNTIKSRLRRAQQRLKQEEPIVREALEHFQITPHLTENIMREISRLKPVAPSGSKPLGPVALSAATAILIFLIMGVGSQYLVRFQRPYNIDAVSETTVEIIDAPIVLDTQAKPALRNQAGRFETTGKSSASGPQLSEPVTLGAAQIEKETRPSTQQQWVQGNAPQGGMISGLFLSTKGDTYAASAAGIYRLSPNASAWTLINTSVASKGLTLMAEREGTLYLVSGREVYTSTDRGENWQSLGGRPKGEPIGFVITDNGLYLALAKQIFRSTDAGKQWVLLDNEDTDRINFAIAAIENTVFIGTNRGLYRLYSDTLEKLPVDTTKAILSLAVSERNLYVGTGPNFSDPELRATYMAQLASNDTSSSWEIFHSTDLGDSWTDITPISESPLMKISPGVKVLAADETLLALGFMSNFRSTDAGKTWTDLSFDFDTDTFDMNAFMNSVMMSMSPAVTVAERTFIKASVVGLTRSTDGGKSWLPFMKGIVGTHIFNLVAFKNAIYTSTMTGVSKSIDGGNSWQTLSLNAGELTLKPAEDEAPPNLLIAPKLLISNGVLYGITPDLGEKDKWRILRLSAGGNVLVPIQGVPAFPEDIAIETRENESRIASKQAITDGSAKDREKPDDSIDIAQQTDENQRDPYPDGFAVSGDTFYVEYKQRLFRWTRGAPRWTDTGLRDVTQPFDNPFDSGFKIAVSEETVYVGKRDGHLLRSPDGGNTWKDLTPNLPFRFDRFNQIVIADSTVYVATDAGVLTSADGEHWRAITDKEGAHGIIDRIAVADAAIYGAGDTGVYKLNNRSRWEQILPEVPDHVISFVANNDKLYIATKQRGMFHISLENEND